jgi:hypothetical protein
MQASLKSSFDFSLVRWFRNSNPQVVKTIAQTPSLGELLSFVEEPQHIKRLEMRGNTLVIDFTHPLQADACWEQYLKMRPKAAFQIAILTQCAGDPYLHETSHRCHRRFEDWQ